MEQVIVFAMFFVEWTSWFDGSIPHEGVMNRERTCKETEVTDQVESDRQICQAFIADGTAAIEPAYCICKGIFLAS